jgi:hypothetical protein
MKGICSQQGFCVCFLIYSEKMRPGGLRGWAKLLEESAYGAPTA